MSVFEWLDAAGKFALIDGVVKAGVLMLAALFLASRLKRESAALRHALWAATFAALVVMPFAASLASVWGVQVDAPAVRLQPAAAVPPPAATEGDAVVTQPAHTEGAAPVTPEGGLRGPDGESTAPTLLGRAVRVPWMTVAGIVYLVGCVAPVRAPGRSSAVGSGDRPARARPPRRRPTGDARLPVGGASFSAHTRPREQ